MSQPIVYMCKTICSLKYTIFSCILSISASTVAIYKQTIRPTVCLEIWKRYCRRCTSRLSPKTPMLQQISLEPEQLLGMWCPTIFGPTEIFSSSKSAGASRVNLLCFPQNSWHIKSATQPVPLYTHLFLYNSVCQQRFSRRFLLLHNK